MSVSDLRSRYMEQFTNILSGAYKAGRKDAMETEEVTNRIQAEAEKAYCEGVKDAIDAVMKLNQMNVSQVADCLGVYENTLEYIIPQVAPITFVRKIHEWSEKPHWMPYTDNLNSCRWAEVQCSKCGQGGYKSWKHCPNCGAVMEGVESPDD